MKFDPSVSVYGSSYQEYVNSIPLNHFGNTLKIRNIKVDS